MSELIVDEPRTTTDYLQYVHVTSENERSSHGAENKFCRSSYIASDDEIAGRRRLTQINFPKAYRMAILRAASLVRRSSSQRAHHRNGYSGNDGPDSRLYQEKYQWQQDETETVAAPHAFSPYSI